MSLRLTSQTILRLTSWDSSEMSFTFSSTVKILLCPNRAVKPDNDCFAVVVVIFLRNTRLSYFLLESIFKFRVNKFPPAFNRV